MKKTIEHNGQIIIMEVLFNNSSTRKKQESRFWGDTNIVYVYLHEIRAVVDGKVLSIAADDHELEAKIIEVEKKVRQYLDELKPRVNPNIEKLKKLGFE